MKTRIAIISFFLGLNIILGSYFLLTVRGQELVPDSLKNFFADRGIADPNNATFPLDSAPDYSIRIDLDSDAVITAINDQREAAEKKALFPSNNLHQVAEYVLADMKKNNFQFSETDGNRVLEESLKKANYFYGTAYQSIVVGPVTSAAVVEYWFNNNQQQTILAEGVSEIGVATTVESIDSEFTGITVVVIAEPRGVTKVLPSSTPEMTKPALPAVSDQEVIDALNSYRKVHGAHDLKVNDHLCSYAEKRVADLVAYGGLDNHQGFKEDFADPEKVPEELKDYPAGKIGENLAHQFCRNMTTGDSFVAETGTALIEWCFDSSTKGHREAQLSKEFHNVCVRHEDGMYVVIFGE
ncbi:MAG: hypothetical protein QG639_306 [Patescibacteria group bacterium]|jgi:uncharacterized protein YkwD|nr:hypothetical protein [Patescibacteria group bacterium]